MFMVDNHKGGPKDGILNLYFQMMSTKTIDGLLFRLLEKLTGLSGNMGCVTSGS
jgi:hypothetical protein